MADEGKFGIFDDLKRYLDIKLSLMRLSFRENSSKTIASVIPVLAIIIFASLFLLFSSFAIAFVLGEKLESMLLGFLIVGLFYGLLALIIYLLRSKIVKYFTDFFIKVTFKNFED